MLSLGQYFSQYLILNSIVSDHRILVFYFFDLMNISLTDIHTENYHLMESSKGTLDQNISCTPPDEFLVLKSYCLSQTTLLFLRILQDR